MNKKNYLALIGLFLLTFLVVVTFIHNVPKSLDTENNNYLKSVLIRSSLPLKVTPKSFKEELKIITDIQSLVLSSAPKNIGIPHESSRTIRDVFKKGEGLCYDRSRIIEEILTYYGFKTRHVSLFLKKKNFIEDIIMPGLPSHAISEVLTKDGWLTIDSNSRSLFYLNGPLDSDEIRELDPKIFVAKWPYASSFFAKDYYIIYGLYSRHGRFYEPYNSIPDYNIRELFYNVID